MVDNKLTKEWQFLIIHHSTTKDSKTFNFQEIRQYHKSYRIDYEAVPKHEYHLRQAGGDGKIFEEPWVDIGYHFGIEDMYGNYEIVFGRPLTSKGAHCKHQNMNSRGIGIIFVGNYDKRAPDYSMLLTATTRLIVPLCYIFKINHVNVLGHREVAKDGRTCPGKEFDMNELRNLIKKELF